MRVRYLPDIGKAFIENSLIRAERRRAKASVQPAKPNQSGAWGGNLLVAWHNQGGRVVTDTLDLHTLDGGVPMTETPVIHSSRLVRGWGEGSTAMGRHSFYGRVGALGFGLIALTGLVALGVGIATGTAAPQAGFALGFMVAGLLVAGLVWRFGRWALILAAVLALALLALFGPYSLFTLSHPESAADFVPIVLALAGALLGLAGSVGAIVQWRRGTERTAGTSAERLALNVILGEVGLAILPSIVFTLVSRTAVSVEAKAGATSVQIINFGFAPNTLQVKADDTVCLVLKTEDATLHTFTLPQAGVNVSVPPGSDKVIEFTAPAAGTYSWYCIPHSMANGAMRTGMVGTLQAP